MYNIADKMITGCKLDFSIFAILTLQIPIECFDMTVYRCGQWMRNRIYLEWPNSRHSSQIFKFWKNGLL